MTSELLASTGGGETIGGHAKQCLTPCCINDERTGLEQGTWLRYQITLDATSAIFDPHRLPFCMVLKGKVKVGSFCQILGSGGRGKETTVRQ